MQVVLTEGHPSAKCPAREGGCQLVGQMAPRASRMNSLPLCFPPHLHFALDFMGGLRDGKWEISASLSKYLNGG